MGLRLFTIQRSAQTPHNACSPSAEPRWTTNPHHPSARACARPTRAAYSTPCSVRNSPPGGSQTPSQTRRACTCSPLNHYPRNASQAHLLMHLSTAPGPCPPPLVAMRATCTTRLAAPTRLDRWGCVPGESYSDTTHPLFTSPPSLQSLLPRAASMAPSPPLAQRSVASV